MSAAASIALTLGLGACSTPSTENVVAQNPSEAKGPMKNVAVFAGRVPEADRRNLEDAYVDGLSRYGVHATPSYSLFAVGQVPKDQAEIRTFLKQGGYDGALVSAPPGIGVPVLVAPGMDWAGGFCDSYFGSEPGDVETEPPTAFEVTLWNPNSSRMVWSIFTKTKDPSSWRDDATKLTRRVLESLARQGLIPVKVGPTD